MVDRRGQPLSRDAMAYVLAGGRGSRLMPTTENAPKCYAEIRGKRILDWTVEALQGGGCSEIDLPPAIAGYWDIEGFHNGSQTIYAGC